MATNLAIITDALRLLGVIAENETPSAEQGQHALDRMTRMLESWVEDGVDLGWFEQSSTADTAQVPKWAERGVISKLAQDLQATYPSARLQPWVRDDQQNGYGVILRRTVLQQLKGADMSHMPVGTGNYGYGWNIETDL
jgi:hypothetical protein